MGVQHESLSPFPDNPNWAVCLPSGKAEPVRDEPTSENVAVVRSYVNTSMPTLGLQITVTAPLTEPGDGSRQAAEEGVAKFLDGCRVAFGPDDSELTTNEEVLTQEESPDEGDVEVEKVFHLDILERSSEGDPWQQLSEGDPSQQLSEGDPSQQLIVHIDPRIGKGKAHIYYLVARTRTAYARVRATKGKVRMGIMKDDDFVSPLTTNAAGGGSSPTVSAYSPTPTTFKVRIRGLHRNNKYRMSTGWKLY